MEDWFWGHILTLMQTNNIGHEVYNYFENTSFIKILNAKIEINKMNQKINFINTLYARLVQNECKDSKFIKAYQECYNDIQTTYKKLCILDNSEHISPIDESIKSIQLFT
jgi:hypothetical protein